MNSELEASLENREAIIKAIEQEIVGPGEINNTNKQFNPYGSTKFTSFEELNSNYYYIYGTEKEEVLQGEAPSRRYAAGMLYPFEATSVEEEIYEQLEPESTDNEFYKNKNEDETGGFEEQEGLEEVPPQVQQNDKNIASMGVTFCLSNDATSFKIGFTGGAYDKHRIQADIVAKDKNYKFKEDWWLRKTVYTQLEVKLSDFDLTKRISLNEYELELLDSLNTPVPRLKLKFHIQCRRKEEYSLFTVTVINVTPTPVQFSKDEYSVFQSKIILQAQEGDFLNYPSASERNLEMSDSEWNNELLFKNKFNYAFGHNCSVNWNYKSEKISEISTTFIPTYETESMTPDIEIEINGTKQSLKIEMRDLMNISNHEELLKILYPLVKGYKDWIYQKELETLSEIKRPQLRNVAIANINLCKESLYRMERGLELLKDSKVLKAFKYANKAMLLQQINGKIPRKAHYEYPESNNKLELIIDRPFEEVMENMIEIEKQKNSWRAFQIAFLLMSIQSLVDKESLDREVVDLIWFPTGGGKTEAYLSVAAFQMFYRRLLDNTDDGVDIIMRYTLRLLTADQFQRASRLICAMEFIRRENVSELGVTPYSIGIWVGAKTTPNRIEDALREVRKMEKPQGAEHIGITRCPWCGCQIGKVEVRGEKSKRNESKSLGFKLRDGELIVHCPDKSCHFNNEIPVYFVDEVIYKKRPTFLIGTIDKFVQVTWRLEARKLFGINEDGVREVSPPQLIIQDELHLISGPLGTLTGLYEILIEELCIDDRGKIPVKPKIISATATIKEFEEQAKSLFGREHARLFPNPGIDIDDSFFSKVALDQEGVPKAGRKYIGVFPSKVRILMAQVMTYSAIMQKVNGFPEDQKDPFWTLLSFYNSLRDLGAGLNLFSSDIPTYIDALVKREGINLKDKRIIFSSLELTSRKQSNEITKTIDELNVTYQSKNNKGYSRALNACLASNIIEVGVDIDRLSLMGIVGQPKMTAQYIQVSGRVGRRPDTRPGLIVTIYSNQNSRDKSHYEHFIGYHQRLYAQVETTSLTPFSSAALERGLSAVLIGFLRQRLNSELAKAPTRDSLKSVSQDSRYLNFKSRLLNRVNLIDPEQSNLVERQIANFMHLLYTGRYESWRVSDTQRGLMREAGKLADADKYPSSIPVINSLRSVDTECIATITPLDEDFDEFVW
ncbi:helicase [Chryseomicrobium excrementi]|uniref:Helicase n=1 Tax=Chryseomicrobium excrementi TaxID=2041346 RepID=A0A2M9EYA0_9BACL|nr:helicase-related protein [Chryseomicrobium excrementi]PJK16182.1 helicase [Chryseomicrobium excrementi]